MSAQVPERVLVTEESDHVEVTGISKARVQEALQLLDAADNVRLVARGNLLTSMNKLMVKANMPVVPEATQRQIQRSAALNEELLSLGYETHESLAQKRRTPVSSARTWVSRLRKRNELFTVKLSGKTLIPSVQLTEDGDLRKEVSVLVQPLSKAGLNGWSLWSWLCKPTGLLSGKVPSEVAETNQKRAQKAADRYAAELRLAASNLA